MVNRQDFTKKWSMDQIILAPGSASLLIAHYRRREQELLEASNRYLERARAAEASVSPAGVGVETPPPQTHVEALRAIRDLSSLDNDISKASAIVMSRMADIYQHADAALATTEGSTE